MAGGLSCSKCERQDRMLRHMLWFAVSFMGLVAAWAAWSFLTADAETDVRRLILFATLFLFAGQVVGWAKMFLFSAQKHLSILKELERVQLTLLERE